MVRQRRARSRILQIEDEQGILTDKTEDIENILLNFFKKSYDGRNNLSVDSIVQEIQGLSIPTLSDQQTSFLNKPISTTEIEEVVFQLGPHKAPRPDGIPAFFFQEFWKQLKLMLSILSKLFSILVSSLNLSTKPS